MQDWIARTFDLLCQNIQEGEAASLLKSGGCSANDAEKLVAFVPLACARALLADTGVSFSPTFTCMAEDGSVSEPQSLSSEPLWGMIQDFVVARRAAKPEAFSQVAMRSSEFDAINKAALNGSKLSNLVVSGPIFLFVEPSVETVEKKNPWWAFWR